MPLDSRWATASGVRTRAFSAAGRRAALAAVDEDWLYPTPPALGDNEASAMALVGITAHLGLFRFGQLKSGESVYIPGGSGGVGTLAVQMAKAAGGAASPPPRAARNVSSSAAS